MFLIASASRCTSSSMGSFEGAFRVRVTPGTTSSMTLVGRVTVTPSMVISASAASEMGRAGT